MISAARHDALSDGIFGVAMTLLVLDLRLPENFNPADDQELLKALLALWPKFFPYALSFFVLGLRWRALARVRAAEILRGGVFLLVARLSVASHLRTVFNDGDRPLPQSCAGDLALCRQYRADCHRLLRHAAGIRAGAWPAVARATGFPDAVARLFAPRDGLERRDGARGAAAACSQCRWTDAEPLAWFRDAISRRQALIARRFRYGVADL